MACVYYILVSYNVFTCISFTFWFFSLFSDIGIGQSQDDSIVGLRQTKHIPTALPVSGTLSSSNPDLLQSHHRILDFSTTPGEHRLCCLHFPVGICFLLTYGNAGCSWGLDGLCQMLRFQTTRIHSLLFFRLIWYDPGQINLSEVVFSFIKWR